MKKAAPPSPAASEFADILRMQREKNGRQPAVFSHCGCKPRFAKEKSHKCRFVNDDLYQIGIKSKSVFKGSDIGFGV